jgi:hypothetical protein
MVGGVLVAIGWIVAGILYLTSIGSTERMGVGKKAITAAIVGTILIILAGAAYTIIADLMGYTLSAPGCK